MLTFWNTGGRVEFQSRTENVGLGAEELRKREAKELEKLRGFHINRISSAETKNARSGKFSNRRKSANSKNSTRTEGGAPTVSAYDPLTPDLKAISDCLR